MTNSVGKLLSLAKGLFETLARLRNRLNRSMRARYSANWLAFIAAAICGLMAVMMLFVPHYLGMGNDSLASAKMGYYKLDYIDDGMRSGETAANAYFTRVYELTHLDRGSEFSLEYALVSLAKALDWLFTRDQLFDIRFLALLYFVLYLPGVFLVIKAALERVRQFSEAAALAGLGVLIFSDISYIAYFNSLYADALFFIMLLYMAGCSLLMHRDGKYQSLYMALLGLSCMGFCLVARQGFLAGVVVAFFLLMHLRYMVRRHSKALNIIVASLVLMTSALSLFQVSSEFDDTGKYHAMTRGVLLQSADPVRTLEDMGISLSFSVLANDSLYDKYPVAQISHPLIRQEFLNRYSTGDIMMYYIRHPGALISMWDLGVKAAVNLRRDYCGNYEMAAGMPPMGKSIFGSAWSIFKMQSAPKTIGYLVVLVVIVFIMTGKKLLGKQPRRWGFTYFMTCMSLLMLGVADMTYVMIHSGDAQLIQYNAVLGTVMDILLYFVCAELLHKLNVLEDDNHGYQA
ncbi:MAG: hypothetical protein J1E43_08545 [Christensenellaceae bacterium]|nr:hypothetical protein [Christensenellaceae bacterium]